MKILILGGEGMLGHKVFQVLNIGYISGPEGPMDQAAPLRESRSKIFVGRRQRA